MAQTAAKARQEVGREVSGFELREFRARYTEALLTPAVDARGFDSVYCRWEAGDYRLQIGSTRGRLLLSVQPKGGAAQGVPPEEEKVREYVSSVLRDILAEGDALLDAGEMLIKRKEYGYKIRFRPAEAGSAPSRIWFVYMRVRTDGRGLVLDIPKMGLAKSDKADGKDWFGEIRGAEHGQKRGRCEPPGHEMGPRGGRGRAPEGAGDGVKGKKKPQP